MHSPQNLEWKEMITSRNGVTIHLKRSLFPPYLQRLRKSTNHVELFEQRQLLIKK